MTADESRARTLLFEAEVMTQIAELDRRRRALRLPWGPVGWIVRRRVDRSYRQRRLELNRLLIGARAHLGMLDRLHGRPPWS